MSQVIQHIGAGANSGAYESDGDNDLTYGFFTGTSSRMLMETLNVQNTVQHSDTAQVNNMQRRSNKFLYQFLEQGADVPMVGVGLHDYPTTPTVGTVNGLPFPLDRESDGAALISFLGFWSRQSPSGSNDYESHLYLDASSSEINYNTTIENPLPVDAVYTFTTPYADASTTSFSFGADMSVFDSKSTNTAPVPQTVEYLDSITDETFMHLGPVKTMGRSTGNTATVLTDTDKPTDFDAAGLSIAADDQILIQVTEGISEKARHAFKISARAADTITHGGQVDSGSTTAVGSTTVMTDSGANWPINGLVDCVINNTTDGSSAVITSNTETTITSGALSGGTLNTWGSGDNYTVNVSESATLWYAVFAKNYLFKCDSGSAGAHQIVAVAADVDFTDANFVASLESGDFVALNVTTGLMCSIAANYSDNVLNDANNILMVGSGTNVTVNDAGSRNGVTSLDWTEGDVVAILPRLTLTGLYTDPSASSGGGGTGLLGGNLLNSLV